MKNVTAIITLALVMLSGCGRKVAPSPANGNRVMVLTLGDGTTIRNPDDRQIAEAIAKLDGMDDAFAILGPADMTYIQIAGESSAGYVVEYQDGALDEHYSSTQQDVATDIVVKMFQQYVRGDIGWKSHVEWKKLEL